MSLLRKIFAAVEALAEAWPGLSATDIGVQSLLEYLVAFGYVDDGHATPAAVSEAIRRLQAQAGMVADGIPGPITQRVLALKRCGVKEFSRAGLTRWGKRALTIGVQSYVTGLDRASQDQAIADFAASLPALTGLRMTRIKDADQADIQIFSSANRRDEFGERYGVLAWCEMPSTDGWDSPLRLAFDLAEQWVVDPRLPGTLYQNVLQHEACHGLGLDHSSLRTALMSPFYQAGVGRPVEPDDISRLQNLYGPPETETPAGESVPLGTDLAGFKLTRVGSH